MRLLLRFPGKACLGWRQTGALEHVRESFHVCISFNVNPLTLVCFQSFCWPLLELSFHFLCTLFFLFVNVFSLSGTPHVQSFRPGLNNAKGSGHLTTFLLLGVIHPFIFTI